ncbi:DnaJ-domain-containing protein, partial [Neoconidiobolus thromboides FSU 785]
EIKKAYYKKALRYHPDKQHNLKEEDKPLILKRFQKLQQAYNILSDPLKRKNYDLGVPIEGLESITKTFEEWSDYFKEAFSGKVTESAIEKLKEEYVGSEEEKNDILSYYQKYEGNMDKIIESV